MRLLLAFLLAFSHPVIPQDGGHRVVFGKQFKIVQIAYTDCSSAASCTIPACSGAKTNTCVNPSTTGNQGMLLVAYFAGAQLTFSSGGGGGYSACAACAAFLTAGGGNIIATNTSITGATTQGVTVSASASTLDLFFIEFSCTNCSTKAFDTGGNVVTTSSCSSCTAVPLTLAGTLEAAAQICNPNNTCTAISGGQYNVFLEDADGNAIGIQINSNNGAAPTFTQTPSGTHIVMSAAGIKAT